MADKENGEQRKGLIVSFESIGKLVEVQTDLHEAEAKALDSRLDIEKQLLDAKIASMNANRGLAAAALALYEAFHPVKP